MASRQEKIPPFQEGRLSGDINRAEQVRRDTDTVKIPGITLYDIDYAIIYHMAQNMRLKVQEAGKMIDVPVIYADGEKWSQIKARGYLRDSKNQLMAPIISIRRTGVNADDRLPIIATNQYSPRFRYYPYRSNHNQYDRFGNQSNYKPSQEYYMVDMPSYVRVTYDIMVWTHLIEQLNGLVQQFVAAGGLLWGDYHTFRSVVDNISMNTSNQVGEDRVISADISITVDGKLREDFEYHEATVQKAFTLKTVHFKNDQEVSDFYIEPPYISNTVKHASQEPYHIMNRNRKRNLRYK